MARVPAKRRGQIRASRTSQARAKFLKRMEKTCNVSESARAAGISRSTAYEWRSADKVFADAWDQAEDVAIDRLEKVAWDRATRKDGGSDRMLEILLKAHRREKYVERVAAELTGKDGAPLQHAHAVIEITAEMTPDQAAEAYAKLLR